LKLHNFVLDQWEYLMIFESVMLPNTVEYKN
jgi:hypothetical protein